MILRFTFAIGVESNLLPNLNVKRVKVVCIAILAQLFSKFDLIRLRANCGSDIISPNDKD